MLGVQILKKDPSILTIMFIMKLKAIRMYK